MNTALLSEAKRDQWRSMRPIACCQDPANLTLTFVEKTGEAPAQHIDVCRCGRTHRMAHFEKAQYATKVAAI